MAVGLNAVFEAERRPLAWVLIWPTFVVLALPEFEELCLHVLFDVDEEIKLVRRNNSLEFVHELLPCFRLRVCQIKPLGSVSRCQATSCRTLEASLETRLLGGPWLVVLLDSASLYVQQLRIKLVWVLSFEHLNRIKKGVQFHALIRYP